MPDIFYELNRMQKQERIDALVAKIAIILFALMQIPICFALAVGKHPNVYYALAPELVVIIGLILIYFKKTSIALFITTSFLYFIFAVIPHVFDSYHMTIPIVMGTFIFNTYVFQQKRIQHLNIAALIMTLVSYYIALYSFYEIFFEFIVDTSTSVISFITIYLMITYFKTDVENYEQKLEDVNNFLTQITDINPHFIYAKDKENRFLFINKTMAEFYNYSPEEMIGKKVDKYYESSEIVDIKKDTNIGRNGCIKQLVRVLGENNELTFHELIQTPMLGENEEHKGMLGVSINITNRRKAEIALQESEQRYKQLYENHQLGIVTTNTKGEFNTANHKFCTMTGYDRSEIIGRLINDIMHPEDYANNVSNTEQFNEGLMEGLTFEHRFIRKDKSIGHALVHLQRFHQEGDVVETIATLTDISQLKATEQALRKSEYLYRQLYENHQLAIVTTIEGKFLTANDKFCTMTGYDRSEIINININDIMHPDDYANNISNTEQFNEGLMEGLIFEHRFIRKDKSIGHALVHLQLLYGQEGLLQGIATLTDISQLKATEQALSESESLYRHLFENAFDGIEIYEYSPFDTNEGKLIDRNNKFRNLLGRTDEELNEGETPKLLLSPKMQPNNMTSKEYLDEIRAEFDKKREIHYDWRFTHKKGFPVDVHVSIYEFLNANNSSILIGIFKDITEKKKGEIALSESEALYRHLFENAFDGIEIYEYNNVEGGGTSPELLARNNKLRDLLGRTDKEIDEGEGISAIRLSPQKQANGQDSLEYFSQTRKEFNASRDTSFEWRFTHKKGQPVDMYLTLKEYNVNDKIVLIGIYKDITEQKKSEQIIQQNIDELQQKNQELQKFIKSNMQLENFAYLASHDLKEPIRTIVSFSQLLKRSANDKLSDTEREYIDFVIKGSKNMSMLIEDLLAYSRVDTEDKTIQNIQVSDMLYTVKYELNTLIKSKKASIETENLPETIEADKVQMRQLFQNLITNAIRYSAPERIPKVLISAQEREQEWLFTVSDNGMGIKSEFYERIFLLFRKLHNERDKGTGIGLALCKKIVENHGGRIWVESEYGKGSNFYFTISKKMEE